MLLSNLRISNSLKRLISIVIYPQTINSLCLLFVFIARIRRSNKANHYKYFHMLAVLLWLIRFVGGSFSSIYKLNL